MYRSIRRVYVTKPSHPQYSPRISPIVTEEEYRPTYSVSPNSSPHFLSSTDRYSHSIDDKTNHQYSEESVYDHYPAASQGKSAASSGSTGCLGNLGKWLIPLLICLGLLSAIALAALGLGIYAAIMLSTTSTTTSAPSLTDTSTSNTNAPGSTTMWYWDTNGTTVAGATNMPGNNTGLLNLPTGVALDAANTLYISDYGNNRIQKQSVNAWISMTAAGQSSGTGGSSATTLSGPNSIVLDSSGNMYIADTRNHRIQFFYSGATTGVTIAGTTGVSGTSNGLLNTPSGIVRDPRSGTIYVADTLNHRVIGYSVGSSNGIVVAGGQGSGFNSSQLNRPAGLHFDSSGNSLIIANTGANNVVQWTLGDSSWTLLAGDASGVNGSSSTSLYGPLGVTRDSSGNLYVTDTENHRIQFFFAGQFSGTTVAGNSTVPGNSVGLLNRPTSVALDSQLNLYVADRQNHRIQRFLKI